MRRNEGFTLVELLIVLAVIAALLATITPVALNAVRKAKASQVAQGLRNIKTAIEQYIYTEQPSWFTDGTTVTNSTLFSTLVSENYLSQNPGDNYAATISVSGGTANATVAYTAGDVATDLVIDSYPGATFSGNNVYVEFKIAKYW